MKVRVSASDLREKVSIMAMVLSKGMTEDYQSFMRFDVSKECIRLFVFNDICISDNLGCISDGDFSFLAHAHTLLSFLKNIRGEIELVLSENGSMALKHQNGKMLLSWKKVDGFPGGPEIHSAGADIKPAPLLECLKSAMKFIGDDEFRPQITRVKVDVEDGVMRAYATDLFRLYYDERKDCAEKGIHITFFVSQKCASIMLAYKAGGEGPVRVSEDESKVYIRFSGVTIVDLKCEMKFPDCGRVLSKYQPSGSVVALKDEMLASMRRAESVGADVVSMKFGERVEFIGKSSSSGMMAEDYPSIQEAEGEPFEANVEVKRFIRSIAQIQSNTVRLSYSKLSRAIMLEPDGNDGIRILNSIIAY